MWYWPGPGTAWWETEREREKVKHKVIVALGWWDGTCSGYISSHSIVSIKGKGEKMF